ncbi:hypothetical protein [Campylobacter concisus]
MSVIEKFITNFCSIASEPRLTSFSKFKYHKQDRSNGYFCKQMINFKTSKPFLKFTTKFTKSGGNVLEIYLKRWCRFKFCGFKS